MIKLLALDLDGTLLDSRGKISEANKIPIQKAEERGKAVYQRWLEQQRQIKRRQEAND